MPHRYRYIAFLVLALLALSGCRPKGILRSGEMREILIDLHKTDAILQVTGRTHTATEIKTIYYAQVLEKHGITQAQFDSSLVWYTAHPQLFDKIYPKVMADLKEEEEKFVALHEDELNLQPGGISKIVTQDTKRTITKEEMDSVLWIMRNGYPTLWKPLLCDTISLSVHDSVNQLFPKVGILGGRVVDSLETRIGFAQIADN